MITATQRRPPRPAPPRAEGVACLCILQSCAAWATQKPQKPQKPQKVPCSPHFFESVRRSPIQTARHKKGDALRSAVRKMETLLYELSLVERSGRVREAPPEVPGEPSQGGGDGGGGEMEP